MKTRVRKKYPKYVTKWAFKFLRDNCQVCHGTRGGQWGNENVIGGVVMCDYCTMERMTCPCGKSHSWDSRHWLAAVRRRRSAAASTSGVT